MADLLIKELKITNNRGDSIEFGRHFKLIKGLDLSDLSAQVSYSSSTRDGGNYQKTTLDIRELDLSFFLYNNFREVSWIEGKRRELFRVFNPKHNPMKLEFTSKGGSSYYLNANLESTPSLPQGFDNDNAVWQKGLLQFTCADPFIYSSSSTVEDIASWIGNFEFPLEIPEEGIEMGYRSQSLIKNIWNSGDNELGMVIEFKALASVTNPSLINVNSYEQLLLNVEMQGGDIIRVNTNKGKKGAVLIRNNVETNAFNTIDVGSDFLQLEPGDNLFRYDAVEGLENLEVRMIFRATYTGV